MQSATFYGGLAVLLWTFVLIPAVIITLLLYQRKKRRGKISRYDKRRSHSQNARRYTDTQYSTPTSYTNSRVVPQSTQNGEVVKSGGERIIADYLYENGIQYEYEKPATDASGRRISKPDFFLPEHNVYVEYWGMVNSNEKLERQEYVKSMEWKIKRYHDNGMKFISIYPQDLGNLDAMLRAKLHHDSQA
jgi:hypothetical protein